jgi:PHD/YefM family antitoxin component YafN of YafNO toxin-antitoxin module
MECTGEVAAMAGPGSALRVKKATATEFRKRLRQYLRAAKGGRVVLVENRRQGSRYLVEKEWLDGLLRERESILATLEVLSDPDLTRRLLELAPALDKRSRPARLHSMEEAFGTR